MIPLIALFMIAAGSATLIWYHTLSQEDQKRYDNALIGALSRILKLRGIPIEPGDDRKTIEVKAQEAGMSKAELNDVIKQAAKDAKETFRKSE